MSARGGFWSGKRVFITGHTGFKGSWLALMLDALGAEVYGYSLAPASPSLYEAAGLVGRFGEIFADIRDGRELREELCGFAPDVVFHLAAQPLVRASYRDPVATYETNVMGTVNLLEAVRCSPSVRSCVVVTTDKCYQDMEWEWGYRETDHLGGADPYSSSKACAELVAAAWRSSYLSADGVRVATARAGNVIGGGDYAEDRLVPDVMRAFANGDAPRLRSPRAVRPWQHVLDPLNGYLTLARRLYGGDESVACGWNFGPPADGSECVENVVKRIAGLWGGALYEIAEDHRLHESQTLRLDSGRALQILNWRPVLALSEAIGWTVEWYARVADGASALALTEEQIRRFADAAGDLR